MHYILSIAFFLLILQMNQISGDINHQEPTLDVTLLPTNSSSNSNTPTATNQTRNSRQLMSLLKNLLRQPAPAQQQQQQLVADPIQQYPPPQQNSYQQNPLHENQYPGASFYPYSLQHHSANIPSVQNSVQYPLLNYPTQQHSSVPLYQQQMQMQPDQSQLFQTVTNPTTAGGGGSNSNSLLTLLSSVLGAGGGNSQMVTSMLSKLGLGNPEDLDLFSLLNFGSIEGMLGRVNRFDKLQCIPRMICQMVAKRNEDARIKATSTTTSTTTEKSVKKSKKKSRQSKFFKIDGVDTALDQFVKFLDLMQLKDWSLYPYVKGMTEGHTVTHPGDCAHRFHSCPFSEDQLVYYFNNYNGGFFQSFRSGRQQEVVLNSTVVGEV